MFYPLPPARATGPQYLFPVAVDLLSLTEPRSAVLLVISSTVEIEARREQHHASRSPDSFQNATQEMGKNRCAGISLRAA